MSHFYPDRPVDLVDHSDVTPAVNQIETHPFFQRTSDQELMRERGIQIESWGPFAEGKNDLFSNPILSDIGATHGKSIGQVVSTRRMIPLDLCSLCNLHLNAQLAVLLPGAAG